MKIAKILLAFCLYGGIESKAAEGNDGHQNESLFRNPSQNYQIDRCYPVLYKDYPSDVFKPGHDPKNHSGDCTASCLIDESPGRTNRIFKTLVGVVAVVAVLAYPFTKVVKWVISSRKKAADKKNEKKSITRNEKKLVNAPE